MCCELEGWWNASNTGYICVLLAGQPRDGQDRDEHLQVGIIFCREPESTAGVAHGILPAEHRVNNPWEEEQVVGLLLARWVCSVSLCDISPLSWYNTPALPKTPVSLD